MKEVKGVMAEELFDAATQMGIPAQHVTTLLMYVETKRTVAARERAKEKREKDKVLIEAGRKALAAKGL